MRPWIILSTSSGETFSTVWQSLGDDVQQSFLGAYGFSEKKSFAQKCSQLKLVVKQFPRESFENKLLAELDDLPSNTVILLCGYMSLLSANFVQKCERVTHPSLLPAYPGLASKVHKDVYENSCVSGFSVHLVNEKLDNGPILFQKTISLLPQWTEQEMKKNVRALEQKHLGYCWSKILQSKLSCDDRLKRSIVLRKEHDFTIICSE